MRYLLLMALATAMVCGCHHVGSLDGDTGPVECNLGEYSGNFRISPHSDGADIAGYTSISGDLHVEFFLEELDNEDTSYTDLSDLICLTSVGGNLTFYFVATLPNVDGLGALTSVGGGLLFENTALDNMDGLGALTSVGEGLCIDNNDTITDLDGLGALTSVRDGLVIRDNDALTNVDGLGDITSVDWYMGIHNNDALANLDGLSAITSVGDFLYINNNDALTNLDGLSALISVGGDLYIYDNPNLPDCEACDLLGQLTTGPTLIDVHDNLSDSCTPVPAGCP